MSNTTDLMYSDSVEVSNACRRFYVSRLQAAEALKCRLTTDDIFNKTNTFCEIMAQLRSELASLIDIDLEVMRQLLMLNDQVEELKWQRRQSLTINVTDTTTSSHDVTSACRWSSCDLSQQGLSKYPTPSTLSLLRSSSQDLASSIEDIPHCVQGPQGSGVVGGGVVDAGCNVFYSPAVVTGPITLVIQQASSLTKHTAITSATPRTKERPPVKPKPKSVAVKGGELRVSFTTPIMKPSKSSDRGSNSSGNTPNDCFPTLSPVEPTSPSKHEGNGRRIIWNDKNIEKIDKPGLSGTNNGGKHKDTAVHSIGGSDSYNELSTYVEMLI